MAAVSGDDDDQAFVAKLLKVLHREGVLEVEALHAVIAQFLARCLDDLLPGDVRAQWEPNDTREPLALMVRGSPVVLDDQFPEGDAWAFLRHFDALREHCFEHGDAPRTPTQAGTDSFAFAPTAAPPLAEPARDHGKQLRHPQPTRSASSSESSGSDSDDSDSGDSGPPPRRSKPPASPDTGCADVARVLARHGLTIEDCRNSKKLGNKKGFVKQNAIDALCDLAVGGHAAQAPGGGAGPGASIGPGEGATIVSEFTKAMTKQTVEFRRAVTKQTDAMVGLQERTLHHLAGQTQRHVDGYVRLALGTRDAPQPIEARLPCSDSGESGKKRKDPGSRFEEVEVSKKASSQQLSGDKN
ncbi:hypothetical protein KFL_011760050 [Klebsormidium nitens]|uniref:Uncharacterized protein n=1 Tax=Klebsormidium nitens TaxID=105231 RepID=A0A1Y1IPN5_KLENI|nr:hypothetical protein KFL_011760050 [Klebsormidium nitens]|eukprot:GAQ92875.1 hypothetical protein KFL_011760050 [Klebsormidium nitens]